MRQEAPATTLTNAGQQAPSPELTSELDKAADLAKSEKAVATRRAYRGDIVIFGDWCRARGLAPLPATPEAVCAFIAAEATRNVKPSTIARRVAAIRYAHKLAGLATPTEHEQVKATVRGVRRTLGTAPQKKAPATAERLIAMATVPDDSLQSLRDRSLLLLGFAGAFRRSELVALDVRDIEKTEQGLRVTVRHSKSDQEAVGAVVAIVRGSIACPVQALGMWLSAAGISQGPLFRPIRKDGKVQTRRLTDRSVANIIKTHAMRAGLDPSLYSGHSLRSGFVTSAARRGASLFKLMDVTRHKNVETLRGYVRDAELFLDHAGTGLL
jgi:site-specific recombinase XerD